MVYFRYIAYISEISLGAIRGNVRWLLPTISISISRRWRGPQERGGAQAMRQYRSASIA